VRPRPQQEEMEAEGQKLIDLFSSRSQQDRDLLQGVRINPAISCSMAATSLTWVAV